jgi:general secretion pathway protein D
MKRILLSGLLLSSSLALAQPPQQALAPMPPLDRPSAALVDLIERVADDMDKEFIYNPATFRGIAVSSLGEDADYESLRGILRASGWVTVETADQIQVLPEGNMRSLPSRVLNEDDRRVSDNEIVTRIITLPATAEGDALPMAAQLVPILRPMMPQNGQMGAPANANKLVITDYYDNVRRMTEIIEALVDE